jgi:hypothetical protein
MPGIEEKKLPGESLLEIEKLRSKTFKINGCHPITDTSKFMEMTMPFTFFAMIRKQKIGTWRSTIGRKPLPIRHPNNPHPAISLTALSNMDRQVSISPVVTVRGGENRMVFSPHPNSSSPL